MSLAPQIPDVAPLHLQTHISYHPSENELRLRSQFVAALTDAPRSAQEMHTAVWGLTDELKAGGELAEAVVKRIKSAGALRISSLDHAAYKSAQSRLTDSVNEAISLSIARYFSGDSARETPTPAGGT